MARRIDKTTRLWIRNRSDEVAAAAGCRFDLERATHAVYWIERYCRLYEGEQAGQALRLRSCEEIDSQFPVLLADWPAAFDEASARAWAYMEAFSAGVAVDWQYEVTMRVFGWVKHSDRWRREVRRFRKASVWVPKKNKKSPTLAAFALYLGIGDGEPGQKVFLCAKDGKQAKEIAGRHAIEMAKAAPELVGECEFSANEGRILHRPTASIIQPLSSGQSNTQKAKEGINGSVIVDETHVVDREFIKRVARAGISRSEPLHAEFSTAGHDPLSYGKARWDYGLKVEAGEKVDEQFFFASYHAPQDLTDDEFAADPIRFGRIANPAWGHTVGAEEFLGDYNESKESATSLIDFRVYRLNIWATAAATWLRPSDWAGCYEAFTAEELAGLRCCAGFDLAKILDFTALTLVFPDPKVDGLYRQLPFFWLPEKTAHERAEKAPYLDWAKAGHVRLTPGDVCDYELIVADVGAILKQFEVLEMAFDPWNAEATTQQLHQVYGVARHEFPQTMPRLTEATKEYERLVRSGNLRHNGHPVLTWQAGHVRVKGDLSGNKRPVKPEHGDLRTIDGIIAGVMALDRCLKRPKPSKGSLFIC